MNLTCRARSVKVWRQAPGARIGAGLLACICCVTLLGACSSSGPKRASSPTTTAAPTGPKSPSSTVQTPHIKADMAAFKPWCAKVDALAGRRPFDEAAREATLTLLKQSPVPGAYDHIVKQLASPDQAHSRLVSVVVGCRALGYLR
jgi:hypothetical protein